MKERGRKGTKGGREEGRGGGQRIEKGWIEKINVAGVPGKVLPPLSPLSNFL